MVSFERLYSPVLDYLSMSKLLSAARGTMKRTELSSGPVTIPGVYHSLRAILLVLEKSTSEDIATLKEAYENSKAPLEVTNKPRKPFIVVEGLDGCGKSTLVTNLSKSIGATLFRTPPPVISSLRERFDALGEEMRRAYYALGNYVAAEEAAREILRVPVVMDRFWHSTCAYAMANYYLKVGDFPSAEGIMKWPEDLLKPDLVLFLDLPEDERLFRLKERNKLTWEETELQNNHVYRQKILNGYSIIEPAAVKIDSSGTKQDTLKRALEVVKQLKAEK